MDKPITYDELTKVTRSLARMVANALIESEVTQLVMMRRDPTVALEIDSARKSVREGWKDLLERISKSDPGSFDSILRDFEGPLQ